MSSKKNRLDVLRYLLSNKRFDNQIELLRDLRAQGFDVAQPTLSRDLHYLKVSKVYDEEGHSVYSLPQDVSSRSITVRKPKKRINHDLGFLKAVFSDNLLLIKTLHGYASSMAAEIDNNPIPEVLGSLAGDDTVLLVLKEKCDRDILIAQLERIIPHFYCRR
ncbi:MAG: arginine repressor [Bacteroidaceae bacterium]|nr:arginine repressor [Bacteroidaceae bacterium]